MQRPLFCLYLSLLAFVQIALGSRHISRLTAHHKIRADNSTNAAEVSLWWQHSRLVENIKSAMLASIRTRCVLSLWQVFVIDCNIYIFVVGSKGQHHKEFSKPTIPNTLYSVHRRFKTTEVPPPPLYSLP
jgi:hypothetical protein